jgi:hypothetical protein
MNPEQRHSLFDESEPFMVTTETSPQITTEDLKSEYSHTVLNDPVLLRVAIRFLEKNCRKKSCLFL